MSSPILITVYNRTEHLKKCIERLACCKEAAETELYISSDAAYRKEDVEGIVRVREYIASISGFRQVIAILHETNRGLVHSYHHAVDIIFQDHDSYIFLEDDVLVAPDFLTYMNQALEFYKDDASVFSVCAFSFSVFHRVPAGRTNAVYFTNRFYPWGYAQWKAKALRGDEYTGEDVDQSLTDSLFLERLRKVGEDLLPAFHSLRAQNRMLVLDYLHTYHMVKNNLVAVVPYRTKTFNIGHDGSGTRTIKSLKFMSVNVDQVLIPYFWMFVPYDVSLRDESFNEAQFRGTRNRVKLLLQRLGLLSLAMKIVNWYRCRP